MTIRSKLFILVTATFILFSCAVGGYFLILGPLARIEKERAFLERLRNDASELQTEANLMLLNSLGQQRVRFDIAVKNYRDARKDIERIDYLPSLNLTIQTALNTINKLSAFSDSAAEKLETSLTTFESETAKYSIDNNTVTVMRLYRREPPVPDGSDRLLQDRIQDVLSALHNMNDVLSNTQDTARKQESIIDGEVAVIKNRSTVIFFSSVGVTLSLGFLISLLIARSISLSLKLMQRNIAAISSGDLRIRFGLRSKDEVGKLAGDLDRFLDGLEASFKDIQVSSHANFRLKDELAESVLSATSSTEEIEANTASIGKQMDRLDSMIKREDVQVISISESFERYMEKISSQNQFIDDTVGAVSRMLASMDNITQITRSNQDLTNELVTESGKGREILESSFGKVSEISDSIAQIQDMASVIASIAGKTNILAMNAAIEAAHAGEYGKGFAVVAEEINNLASASADSSKEIAGSIQEIVAKIQEAAETKRATASAFAAVTGKIRVVSDSVNSIYSNLDEVQAGSEHILESMEKLKNNAEAIENETDRIGTETQGLRNVTGDISRISNEVVSNIDEITDGLKLISKAIQAVMANTEKLGSVGSDLDSAVGRFTTI